MCEMEEGKREEPDRGKKKRGYRIQYKGKWEERSVENMEET